MNTKTSKKYTEQPANHVLSDARLLEIAEPFGEFRYGDAQGHKRIAFARAVIAAAGVRDAEDQRAIDTLKAERDAFKKGIASLAAADQRAMSELRAENAALRADAERCYRYMAEPNPYRQAFFAEPPRQDEGCEYFAPIKEKDDK